MNKGWATPSSLPGSRKGSLHGADVRSSSRYLIPLPRLSSKRTTFTALYAKAKPSPRRARCSTCLAFSRDA